MKKVLSYRSPFWETVETVVIALALALLIRHFVVESFVVRGSSMEPTLHDGQRLLVGKFIYWFRPPRDGEIVVFRSPLNSREDLIKRIIAVEGERVEIRRGQVYRNGKPLEEDYIRKPDFSSLSSLTVPPGHVFVLGDNRGNSEDSRYFGPLPRRLIKGKAVVVWWPPMTASLLP